MRPDVWLGVDANQGFAFAIEELDARISAMQIAKVSLVEQPLAPDREADLAGYRSPPSITADESAPPLGFASAREKALVVLESN